MADHRLRSSYESSWLPYTKVTGRSAVRAAIGEALTETLRSSATLSTRNACAFDAGERTA